MKYAKILETMKTIFVYKNIFDILKKRNMMTKHINIS